MFIKLYTMLCSRVLRLHENTIKTRCILAEVSEGNSGQ